MVFASPRTRWDTRYVTHGMLGLCVSGFALILGYAGGLNQFKPALAQETVRGAATVPESQDVSLPHGTIQIDVTDVLGIDLRTKVELEPKSGASRTPLVFDVPGGRAEQDAPAGVYTAYVYVHDPAGGPMLVDVQELAVRKGDTAFLLVNLLEGTSGNRPLQDFDQDWDGALDRVEVLCGTDPGDAASIPGRDPLSWSDRVLSDEARWYRGELHAHSVHGDGRETVAQLVKRAEKSGLDFLAITDSNTMAACADPGFHSDSVVLIPAMEWGSDEMGIALIYGARTLPEPAESVGHAQAVSNRVQAQGGIFAVAHPCFSTAPWQWGVRYVNAIEVWCREWREVPPMSPAQLTQDLTERVEGRLVYSIALASSTVGLSANGQAELFWNNELTRGLKACAIAGSGSASRKVPMAAPVTYVRATEKSIKGILEGLRRGHTFVSSGLRGPKIGLRADVLEDKRADVNIGGVIPLKVATRLEVIVEDAQGKKLQILANGSPISTKVIESKNFVQLTPVEPQERTVYTARVIDTPSKPGFGPVDVLAITSPIYAEDIAQTILLAHPEVEPDKAWIDVTRSPNEPQAFDEWFFTPEAAAAGEIQPAWQR